MLVLPVGGALVAWTLVGSEDQSLPAAPPAVVVPHVAERRPLEPGHAVASLAHEGRPAGPEPASWVELNNEATTDLTRGDLALAVEKLERCRAAEPENAIFTGNLVESLVRQARLEHDQGELEGAVEHLGRAVLLGEARADIDVLRRILERWRRELELGQDDWTEGSDRFELAYDTKRTDILHHSYEVLEHLELCYDDLVRWFETDPLAGSRVRVVLYEPDDFDRLTGLGDWAAGVFDGVVRVSVRDLIGSRDWRYVLRHELVHAFVQALAGNGVPGWLNEGVAQWLEQRPGEIQRLGERLEAESLFSLSELTGSLTTWHDSEAIGRAYAESLLFVDYLQRTYGDEALRRMLPSTSRGLVAASAFQEWTSVPLDVAFQDWTHTLSR